MGIGDATRPGNDVNKQGTAGLGPAAWLEDHAATKRGFVMNEPARKRSSGRERLCGDDEGMALIWNTIRIARF